MSILKQRTNKILEIKKYINFDLKTLKQIKDKKVAKIKA
jgi:hypothetical protein